MSATEKTPCKTSAERQAKFAAKQRVAGRIKRTLWLSPSEAATVTAALAGQSLPPNIPDLPDLTGSDKQITWADELREHALRVITRRLSNTSPSPLQAVCKSNPKLEAEIINYLVRRTSARWWIDSRHRSGTGLIQFVLSQLADDPIKNTPLDAQVHLARAQLQAEATVTPADARSRGTVELSLADAVISAVSRSFDERFNAHVKSNGFHWSDPAWERTVNPEFDPVNSFVALASLLLSDDYSVCIFDDELRKRVIADDYIPEPRTMLAANISKRGQPQFRLSWSGARPRNINALANLPGSHLFDDAIYIPARHHDIVLDFCEQQGIYVFKDVAQVVAYGEVELLGSVKVKARKPKAYQGPAIRKAIKEVGHGIAPALLDTD